MTDDELDLEGNDGEAQKKPAAKKSSGGGGGRGRPSNDSKERDRGTNITAELSELAEWIERRDEELAQTLKESAPRMAKLLAAYAGRNTTVARVVDLIFSKTGPLALLRGFGPTLRLLGDRVGARRARTVQYVDEEGYLVDPDTRMRILDETGNPIRGDA
jgi:hypothetical protein